jgi:hypothetical protein
LAPQHRARVTLPTQAQSLSHLTFNGGNPGVVIGPWKLQVSDPIDYLLDDANDLVVKVFTAGSPRTPRFRGSWNGWQSFCKLDDSAATAADSGFTQGTAAAVGVAKVETFVAITHRDAVPVLALAVVFPIIMVAAAPAVAFGIHRVGFVPGAAHSSVLVGPVERLWRETTDAPLKVFGGFEELTDGVAFYMRGHPRTKHVLDTPPTIANEELIAREGVALVCPFRDSECIKTITTRALRSAVGRRLEIDISRRYLGVDGTPARYLVITIPPRAAMFD